jgi:hypothetical protein
MNPNQAQTASPNRGNTKSTQTANSSVAAPKPARRETTPPSDADIAAKAYEIWLAHGQEMGNDQQHWFEARRQLQQQT